MLSNALPLRRRLAPVATLLSLFGLFILVTGAAKAQSYSGTFTRDDQVALFSFAVGGGAPAASSFTSVILYTNSYATGGFDPVLSVFAANGTFLGDNDDINAGYLTSLVAADPTSGERRDSFLEIDLEPGLYTLAVTQFDNFAAGPNLSDGFVRAGDGNFTAQYGGPGATGPFLDGLGRQRTGSYSVNILIPEASTTTLVLAGLLPLTGALVLRRRRQCRI